MSGFDARAHGREEKEAFSLFFFAVHIYQMAIFTWLFDQVWNIKYIKMYTLSDKMIAKCEGESWGGKKAIMLLAH